jgi:hypothetical protein
MKYDFGPRDSALEAAWLIAVPATLVLTVLIAGLIIL